MLRGRMLVVQPAIATVVEETLAAESYEVVPTGAADALRLARELRSDVILLDYAMPGMDGAEIDQADGLIMATTGLILSSDTHDGDALLQSKTVKGAVIRG